MPAVLRGLTHRVISAVLPRVRGIRDMGIDLEGQIASRPFSAFHISLNGYCIRRQIKVTRPEWKYSAGLSDWFVTQPFVVPMVMINRAIRMASVICAILAHFETIPALPVNFFE